MMVTQQMTWNQSVVPPIAVSDFRDYPVVPAFDSVNAIGANPIHKQGLGIAFSPDPNKLSVGNASAPRQVDDDNPSIKEPLIFGVEASRKVIRETTLKASKYAVLELSE